MYGLDPCIVCNALRIIRLHVPWALLQVHVYPCMVHENLQCYTRRPTKDFASQSSWLACSTPMQQVTA